MEIQINVLNEMKKLRTSTYADKYTWVDELIQNAQRAGATNIHVTLDHTYETITIEDNGCGCTDPQVLFRKSDTGWDSTVVQNESPFGEGFFSTMMAANKIIVESVGFSALFDVKKMFDTGDINCIEITPCKRKSGFKVILADLTSDCRLHRVNKRFVETGKYLKSPSTYIDGVKVPYEGLTPKDKSKYTVKLDNDMFSGWLMPYSWRSNQYGDNYIKTFAYGRYVKDLPHHDIMRGIVNLKPGAVTLRSPDRKDIIQDEQYDRLIQLVEDGIKATMVKILRYGDDEIIKNYDYYITKYLTPEECRKYIKFKFVDDKVKPEDFDDPTVLLSNDDGDGTDDGADDAPVYDDSYNDTFTGPTMSHVDPAPPQQADDAFMEPIIPKRVRNMPQSEQTGQTLDDVKYAFYVKREEMFLYNENLDTAKKNKIPVIIIRNDIELKCIEQSDNIKAISELSDCVSIVGNFTNASPVNAFEQRIYNLLNGISSRLMNVPDLFVIADTKMHKVLGIGDHTFDISEIKAVAVTYNGKIYIDRKGIKTYGVSLDNNDTFLNAMDKKFILLNINTIASELAIAKYFTNENTKEHYHRMNEIIQKIIYMLYD